jgi:hypothetical protein
MPAQSNYQGALLHNLTGQEGITVPARHVKDVLFGAIFVKNGFIGYLSRFTVLRFNQINSRQGVRRFNCVL